MAINVSENWQELGKSSRHAPLLLIDSAALTGGAADLPMEAFARMDCLFTGDLAQELRDVAPYLAQLSGFDEHSMQVAETALRGQFGVLVVPNADVAEDEAFALLHRHFRKMNIVYTADGKPLFFRYCDPRVLPDVLSVLDPGQLKEFFGPVQRLITADPWGRRKICYLQDGKFALIA
jgi:hypothetical protein